MGRNKAFSSLAALMATTVACLSPIFAAEPAAPAPAAPAAQSGSKPPSEAFIALYQQSAAALRDKKFDEALQKLDEAEKLESNINAVNLRGAIYTEKRDFPNARKYFQQAVQLQPNAFGPRFNLGEVDFLEKNYPAARAKFQALQKENPDNELVRYKIFLTYLLERNLKDAKELLGQFDFAGDLPAYYFANAAWEFANNQPKVAYGWIGSAQNIYPAQANNLFADSLVEVGWVDPNKQTVESELAPPEVLPEAGEGAPPSEIVIDQPTLLPGKTPTGAASGFQSLPDIPSTN